MAKASLTQNLLGATIQQKIHAFFARRAPQADEASLGLKNVYIFFSKQGILFGLLLIITFITGVNYSNNLVLGLCFYLFGMWLVGVFYTFVQVSSLSLRLVENSLTQAETFGWVTVELINRSSQPNRQIHLQFDKTADLSLHQGEPQGITVPSVQGSMLVRLPVYADKRGRMTLPRLVVSSTYPLGVMRAWAYVYFKSPMFVYPAPLKFDWQNHQYAPNEGGEQFSPVSILGQSDFDMLDTYKEGESLGRVSWAHVARGMGMLTKHFADPVGHELRLDYYDMPSHNHESRLSELSYAISELQTLQVPFMLVLPSGAGEIGAGETFVRQSLLRLAKEK